MFGVVGVPIVAVGSTAQKYGIKFVGCRHEQSACFAAQAMGYLTKRPTVCLTASGPGFLNTLSGLANAAATGWPTICVAGSSDTSQVGRGAFQEWPQMVSAQPYCKYTAQPSSLQSIPFHVEKAVRHSMYGRPGPSYIDIPGNLVLSEAPESEIEFPSAVQLPPPASVPASDLINEASAALKLAEKPLVIIGKGAAWSETGTIEINQFINETQLPFLSTPAGKGIVSDDHELSVASARSVALREADVILLVGARLNWILHHGRPPRFNKDVKILQVDIVPEQIHENKPASVAMVGDVGKTIAFMREKLGSWKFNSSSKWAKLLAENAEKNKKVVSNLANDHSLPLNYYAAYSPIRDFLCSNDVIVISEGANTMDIGRTMMPSLLPRRRLDAGTFGTMGVGLGYAIAAALYARDNLPDTKVLAVLGDSAFGFSGMELETITRYRLPVVVVVVNNSGIYNSGGISAEDFANVNRDRTLRLPVLSLCPECRYDKMCEALGGSGFCVRSVPEIQSALQEAFKNRDGPSLINIIIAPDSERKAQKHPFLTRSHL